ncbi:type VII toxin-antitoxin system HepT family RNase toxin [Halochromatium glycolicum]|uniref:DUF86 domain-containing protein n=1 Tax=Halochromatium glycolicum TaxID=85075 RepID=A0AAJ0U3J4_9GAMM|nr:DUF86 domain-containing protein [Halochromatium glycolicum]MBK1704634.1 hypothetical protein [Halochromatium glycolicum]
MTDADLVRKKLAFIETCLGDLRRLAQPEAITLDLREERFAAYTLQIAIQAALDVASHIVSDDRLGEPSSNRALFELLVKWGWLPGDLAAPLSEMVGFRNILVHGYQAVDPRIVRDVVEHRLDDLKGFVSAIRSRLPQDED